MSTPSVIESEPGPFDPDVLADPWDYYRRLREQAPVHRDAHTGIYFISSYRAVSEAARDWETFSNRFGVALNSGGADREPSNTPDAEAQRHPPVDTMLTADPPEQRRFRKLVNKAFTVRRVEGLSERVHGIAHALIDGFVADDKVDLLARFAQPLPLTVIAEQLGAPHEDLHLFRRWTDGFLLQLSGTADEAGRREAQRLISEFQEYFERRLEERRAAPRDDILSDIVHATVEDERSLSVAEMLSILQQLLVAGNETTASAITEGVWLLIRNPDQLELARRDPTLLPNLVEEVLRVATPTANMWRVCKRDCKLEGVEIPAGALCMLRFAAADRDPAVFPDPDRFDITRENAGEHLAFGLGIHFCLGAALARKEMLTAFETLLERLEGFSFDDTAPAPRHRPNVLLWGFDSLPIRFRARNEARRTA